MRTPATVRMNTPTAMAEPRAPRLRFTKMHGAGNDFVVLDLRDGTPPAELKGVAPASLMKTVTREADYAAATRDFL